MKAEEIKSVLEEEFPNLQLEPIENAKPEGFIVPNEALLEVMSFLRDDEKCYFDMLSCLTGVDNGPESETMEVVYTLYSIPHDESLSIKVITSREKPEVNSLVEVWKTADWQEREAYDMFGIHFSGHPDLRRILMPADWEGFPLRKDYQEQKYYRGMEVKY